MNKIIAISLCLFLNSNHVCAAQNDGDDVTGPRPPHSRAAVVPIGRAVAVPVEDEVEQLKAQVAKLKTQVSTNTCNIAILIGGLLVSGIIELVIGFA